MKGKKLGTICVLTLVCTMALSVAGMTTTNNEPMPLNYNNPPNPPVIDGPHAGNTRQTLRYKITITDPDIDDIMFFLEVDFGDETLVYIPRPESCWRSGDVIEVTYKWLDPGSQKITARVQDCSGEWSEWSTPFDVAITRNKRIRTNFHQQLFEALIEYLPILEQLLS